MVQIIIITVPVHHEFSVNRWSPDEYISVWDIGRNRPRIWRAGSDVTVSHTTTDVPTGWAMQ